ncbi:ATP-binding protein [Streptomyces sp. WMMC1477]|uniref:ATP-binding protein n=1 Tax=Streptomyces sp. WMMC1477 TaxID=3015155 RepID=UPI0022B74ADA|nr:ATP-binding protein [Streptomyces sp. WMMC1477]MCZ7430161.1 ATP-binding protein [Streptomyces sp. WMMC1477]MCZ7430174.1 ATP-binding protein [Streptomyces sp. WMMC1477]MCZ7434771.1 ATP-binding protein [Streptomyces sp. WMMC1477]
MTSAAGRTGRLPREREDHYMRLSGAQVVGTKALLRVREDIRAAIEAKAMICVYGRTGHGKSFAVNASLRELAPTRTHRIQFRARPSTRDLRHELFHALGLHGRPPAHAIEFDRMLRAALTEPRVLVCDEAQWLSKLCFEYLRYLWDDTDTDTDLTIIFTGGNGCFEMLQSEPMLESRVYSWQEINPMPMEEVLTVIPAFHPVWADTDPELIATCDREAAHGNFRAWAKITHHLTVGMKETGRTTVGDDLLRWTYSKLSTRTRA